MKIIRFAGGPVATNIFLVADVSTGIAAVIDPAAHTERILAAAAENGFSIKKILLTHGHFDHIAEADKLSALTGAEIFLSVPDMQMLDDETKNGSEMFLGYPIRCRSIPRPLKDGEMIPIGKESLTVLYTPGHTPGSVCFFADDAVFTGDTVFADGFGRTDLWGGNESTLKETLTTLWPRLADRVIYPGHGEYGFRMNAGNNN